MRRRDAVRELRRRALAFGELHHHRQRRRLRHGALPRADGDHAADGGGEPGDHLAHRGREEVDPAHDQHVVGAADAAGPGRGSPAGAGAGGEAHVVAAAEAQERRRAVAEVGIDELALGAVLERQRGAGGRVDQLHMHQAPAGEVHAALRRALAPERDGDVADAHRLGEARAPGGLEPGAQVGLAAARLAGDEQAADARGGEVEALAGGALGEVQGEGGGQRQRVGPEQADRRQHPLAAAGADGDVAEAERGEGVERHRRPRTGRRRRWRPGAIRGGCRRRRRSGRRSPPSRRDRSGSAG